MKKLVSILLMATMALSLSACSQSAPAPAPAATPAASVAPAPAATPAASAAASPSAAAPADKPFSIAMVTDVGGVNDQSFNQSAWEGLKEAEKDYGAKVKYLESQQESNYGPNLDRMTDEDHDIIWGVGFMMGDAILDAATKNPDQMYAIVDNAYETTPENLIGVVFREEEPSFLCGYLAAKSTKTGKVGFVGGISIPVIHHFEFGYKAGVAYANKETGSNVEVLTQYAESFSDDAKGKAIATTMYTNGADIVFHAAGNVGQGVIEAAKEMNKFAIGVDRDQADLAPDNVMTSALKLVGKAMYLVSQDIKDGKKIGGTTISYGITEGAAGIADNASTQKLVAKDVLDATAKISDKIKSGEIKVPNSEEAFKAYADSLK